MSTQARALHWLGDHALGALCDRVTQPLLDWHAQWCLGGQGWQVHARPAVQVGEAEWVEFQGLYGHMWIRDEAQDRAQTAGALWGTHAAADFERPEAHDTWEDDLLRDARSERDDQVAATLVGEVRGRQRCTPPASLFRPGSGAAHISCEGLGLCLLTDASALRHVPPRTRAPVRGGAVPLTPLLAAARGASLRVAVRVGDVELTLDRLLDLRQGDVICLPTRLADPLHLLADGQVLAQAALGHLRQRKAVQLASL